MGISLGFIDGSCGLISGVGARARACAVGVCLCYLAVLVVISCVSLTAPGRLVVRSDGVAAAVGVCSEGAIISVRMMMPGDVIFFIAGDIA